MRIILDRRTCQCWDAPCDTHFGWHFLGEEITPVDCTVDIIDDGLPELTFLIKDRDGKDKRLVVNDSNRGLAYDSWQLAWESQQADS